MSSVFNLLKSLDNVDHKDWPAHAATLSWLESPLFQSVTCDKSFGQMVLWVISHTTRRSGELVKQFRLGAEKYLETDGESEESKETLQMAIKLAAELLVAEKITPEDADRTSFVIPKGLAQEAEAQVAKRHKLNLATLNSGALTREKFVRNTQRVSPRG